MIYILGKVFHQDDTGYRTELLGEANNDDDASKKISDILNRGDVKGIFVIDGKLKKIKIKEVKMIEVDN